MITLEKTPRMEYGSYGEPDVGPPISVALIWPGSGGGNG
jgi:hypothetical protein